MSKNKTKPDEKEVVSFLAETTDFFSVIHNLEVRGLVIFTMYSVISS